MIRCQNCQWWERGTVKGTFIVPYSPYGPVGRERDTRYGFCGNPAFQYTDELKNNRTERGDLLVYGDYTGEGAGFSTGEDFGCVHGEAKE
jgi:hypothetical protein